MVETTIAGEADAAAGLSVKDRIRALQGLQGLKLTESAEDRFQTPVGQGNCKSRTSIPQAKPTAPPRSETSKGAALPSRPHELAQHENRGSSQTTHGVKASAPPPVPARPNNEPLLALSKTPREGRPETSTARLYVDEAVPHDSSRQRQEVVLGSNAPDPVPSVKPAVPPRPPVLTSRPPLPQRPSSTPEKGLPLALPPRPSSRPDAPPDLPQTQAIETSQQSQLGAPSRCLLSADDELPLARSIELRLEELWFVHMDPPRYPPALIEAGVARMSHCQDQGQKVDFVNKSQISFQGDQYTAIYACLYMDFSRYNLRLDWNARDPINTVKPQELIYPPPPQPSKELLIECASVYGNWIHEFCVQNIHVKIRRGICMDLVLEAIDSLSEVMASQVAQGSANIIKPVYDQYGALIYIDRGPQWHGEIGVPRCRRGNDDLQAGDIILFGPATKFEWKEGLRTHTMTIADVGHLAIVSRIEYEATAPRSVTTNPVIRPKAMVQDSGIGTFTSTFFKSGIDKAWSDSKTARKDNATVRSFSDSADLRGTAHAKGTMPMAKDIHQGICHVYEQNIGGRTTVGPGAYRLDAITYGNVRVFRVMDERWTPGSIDAVFPLE